MADALDAAPLQSFRTDRSPTPRRSLDVARDAIDVSFRLERSWEGTR